MYNTLTSHIELRANLLVSYPISYPSCVTCRYSPYELLKQAKYKESFNQKFLIHCFTLGLVAMKAKNIPMINHLFACWSCYNSTVCGQYVTSCLQDNCDLWPEDLKMKFILIVYLTISSTVQSATHQALFTKISVDQPNWIVHATMPRFLTHGLTIFKIL